MRNESETRSQLIYPALQQAGWGVDQTKILEEYQITDGRIEIGGVRADPMRADFILVMNGQKVAIIEAKKESLGIGEGVMQAKLYAKKLDIRFTYATNGHEIYEIDMSTGEEKTVESFPTPEDLRVRLNESYNEWRERFRAIPFENIGGSKGARYYQELAVTKTLEAIANKQQRILLTLATGTGKTFIAFQIAWKLFQSRWNLGRDGARQPRILFLADRNILADQAYNSFSAFPEDALVRISPADIKKKGLVPTNGSIFFTIFQTFMSGPRDSQGNATPYFGDYPADFFDCIIIDECHRGGANDEGNWRSILEYFSPAVQLGLTATPKKTDNLTTYRYFGNPVYTYSLKEGIDDGFLTPFKVKVIQTTKDTYLYSPDDEIIEGEVEQGKIYEEKDFNHTGGIEIEAREKKRVEILLREIGQDEKTIVFCANQAHAALIRDLINQIKTNTNSHYCVRVTAFDGLIGEMYLRDFQDNEKSIPTILTTSQKLSTGVDARNVRNIALMRPVNSMIEFKQIIGRGTRLFEDKTYFTILDFVEAYKNFHDEDWDGHPVTLEEIDIASEKAQEKISKQEENPQKSMESKIDNGDHENDTENPQPLPKTLKIRLGGGREVEIDSMMETLFWGSDGKPVSHQAFLDGMYQKMPEFFTSESELRKIWSNPETREEFLAQIKELGFDKGVLENMTRLISAEKSDLFDVLAYYNCQLPIVSRIERVNHVRNRISGFGQKETEFLNFLLDRYIQSGWEELSANRLPQLLKLKYQSLADAEKNLGDAEKIRDAFFAFQEELYQK